MEKPDPLLSSEIVLVGGGHTHALFLREWSMAPVRGARLTVINPEPTAPYTGMLPGFVAGHYSRDELDIDLVKLARFAGARLIFGAVDGIDPENQKISVPGRPAIGYDIASIDIGITSQLANVPGFKEHGIPAKPLGPFARRWSAFVENRSNEPIALIGGGVAGVELALSMRFRLGADPRITFLEAGTVLSHVRDRTRKTLLDELVRQNIEVLENISVAQVGADAVLLRSGETVPSSFTVGAAGAVPHSWLLSTGLELTGGYITVDANLRSVTSPNVYAVGDCAHLSHAPRPKAGVFAVRAAPVLSANIKADVAGGSVRRFDPQSKYLKLISLGRKEAVADKYAFAPHGTWAWAWKDRIDRAFMQRLNERTPEPQFKSRPLVARESKVTDPLCGGCGSKVGGDILSRSLAKLDVLERPDVLTTAGDDAAILAPMNSKQVLTTDHLRGFWSDPYLMTRIAAVHALNDVFAMGAEPQSMLAQFIFPHMTEAKQSDFLVECLMAANEVAQEAGAALAGGHTSMGAEFSVGFTATGLVAEKPLTLAGAKEDDVVVLSRPVGSGTILAAEMRGLAQGQFVASCLETMASLNLAQTRPLAKVANAMTDVTGFGLAGHAMQMAEASDISIEICLDDVPLYDGAESLAEDGIRSTIYPATRRRYPMSLTETGRAALMFDPQTSGGMLAAIPADEMHGLSGVTRIGRCRPYDGQRLKLY